MDAASKEKLKANIKTVFAGFGLGILTGFIIGLSASEVTGIILGALVSLLAAFFGLRDKKGEDMVNHLLIGSFGFFCVGGIILGVVTRTHEWLAPDLKSKYDQYRELKYISDEDARKIFFLREFGVNISNGKVENVDVKKQDGDDSNLHSLTIDENYVGTTISTQDNIDTIRQKIRNLNKMTNDPFERMMEYIDEKVLGADLKKELMIKLYNVFCENKDEE